METISIRKKEYSDGSVSHFLDLWQNEGEIKYSLKITGKQFKELKKQGIRQENF